MVAAILCLAVVGLAQYKPKTILRSSPKASQKPVWDVHDALGILSGEVGVSVTVAPKIAGKVHMSLEPVPFELKLQSLLHEVHATYRVEAGVYQIYPESDNLSDRSHYVLIDPIDSKGTPTWLDDKEFMYRITGQVVVKVRKRDGSIVANSILPH